MTESSLQILLTGDEAQLVASYRRAVKAQEQSTGETSKLTREAARADKELRKGAEALNKWNADPLKKVQEKIEQINAAEAKGLLNAGVRERALRSEVAYLAQKAQITEKQAAAQLGLSSAYAKGGGIGGKLAGGAGQVGQSLASQVGLPLTMLGAFEGAISAFSDFREFRAGQREESKGMLKARAGMAPLAQLATTHEEYAQRKGLAESLFRQGATESTGAEGLAQAGSMANQLQGSGMAAYAERFGEIFAHRLVAPGEANQVIDRLEVLNNTVAQGQSPIRTLAQALAIRGEGDQMSVPLLEMLESATKISEAARQMGMTAAETLALPATMTELFKNAKQGSQMSTTLMEGLAELRETSAGQAQLAGKTFAEQVSLVQRQGTPEDRRKVLGAKWEEAATAFLANEEDYRSRVASAQKAEESLVDDRLAILKKDTDAVLDHAARVATALKESGNVRSGQLGTVADAIVKERIGLLQQAGASGVTQWAAEKAYAAQRMAVGEKRFVECPLNCARRQRRPSGRQQSRPVRRRLPRRNRWLNFARQNRGLNRPTKKARWRNSPLPARLPRPRGRSPVPLRPQWRLSAVAWTCCALAAPSRPRSYFSVLMSMTKGEIDSQQPGGAAGGIPTDMRGTEQLLNRVLGEMQAQTDLMRKRGGGEGSATPQPPSQRGPLLAQARTG